MIGTKPSLPVCSFRTQIRLLVTCEPQSSLGIMTYARSFCVPRIGPVISGVLISLIACRRHQDTVGCPNHIDRLRSAVIHGSDRSRLALLFALIWLFPTILAGRQSYGFYSYRCWFNINHSPASIDTLEQAKGNPYIDVQFGMGLQSVLKVHPKSSAKIPLKPEVSQLIKNVTFQFNGNGFRT
jgi:hypothetical protein